MLANNVKIIDFGISKNIKTQGLCKTELGTHGFSAPEIFDNNREDNVYDGFQADMYSIGMLSSWIFDIDIEVPKQIPELLQMSKLIPSEHNATIKNQVSLCLSHDPSSRPTIEIFLSTINQI